MAVQSGLSEQDLYTNGCLLGWNGTLGMVSARPSGGRCRSFFFTIYPPVPTLPTQRSDTGRCAVQYYSTWLKTLLHQNKHRILFRCQYIMDTDMIHKFIVKLYLFNISVGHLRAIQHFQMGTYVQNGVAFADNVMTLERLVPWLDFPGVLTTAQLDHVTSHAVTINQMLKLLNRSSLLDNQITDLNRSKTYFICFIITLS